MKKEEKEVHVFRYSQLFSTERRLTISEFSDHSGLSMQAVADIAIKIKVIPAASSGVF